MKKFNENTRAHLPYRPGSTAIDGNILQWNPDGSYTANTYYGNDALWVTDGVDEDLVETRTFVDLAGHTILKRQVLSSGNLDTYYIYNNAGMLIYTVPPNAVALLAPTTSFTLTSAPLSNLVFYFVYDNMGRVVQKTVPAKGVAYIVYDPLNRPVLVQDANMRVNNNWSYIKYDVKGRAISQGTYNDATHTSLAAMQSYVSGLSYAVWYESRTAAGGATGYYTNLAFPTTGTTPLAYAYYDDYNMTESGSPDFSYVTQSDPNLPGEEMATGAQLKGMPTMVTQTTVGSGLTGTWLTTVTFYDRNLHPIQVRSNNHVYYTGYAASANLTDTKTVANDFTGMPLYSKVAKQTAATGGTTTVYTAITYDQVYRVTSVSQAYNSGAYAVVATYNYNELGQVIKKNLGQLSTATIPATINLNTTYSGTNTFVASSSITMTTGFNVPSLAIFKAYTATNYLQNVDYRYNIRGQVLSINNSKLSNDGGVTNTDTNDLFGMLFLYDQKDANLDNGTGNMPSYDGKLTAVKWMTKDGSGNSSYERSYTYSYDGVNRYTGETYSERTTASTGSFSNNVHGFDENNITYDAGGNILTLQRNSSTQGTNSNVQIDNLTYSYSGTNPNQLSTVTDGAGANYTGAGFRNLTGSTGSYSYDANGNLVADPYKGLAFDQYNVLNRPDKITVTAGTGQYINYTYDASGSLIRKQEYNNNLLGTTTDYIDGFVYLTQAAGVATLSYFPMPEGRVINNSGTLKQEFIITDGQGNARISFQDNGSGVAVVTQETSYYGFGLQLLNSPVSLPAIPNKKLYNGGSEWQNDYSNGSTNLPDYYQTFYRNYDAAIGRFVGVDPDPESAESMTNYQYAGNNPIMLNDPDGSKTVPASYNYNYNYVSPLSPGSGPWQSMDEWADQQIGGAVGAISDEGLYYSDPDAYWAAYNASNGTFGGQNRTAQYFDEEGLSPTGQMESAGRSDLNGPAGSPTGGPPPSGTTGAAPGTPGSDTPVGNGYSNLLYQPSGPNVGDDNQGGFAAFYKQYVLSGNISASDFDLNEKTGMVNWAVQTGGSYAFVAQVSFTRSGNAWTLTTNLYYSGPKMDDLVTTTNTSLSLNNPQTGLLNNNLGFDQKNFDNTGSVFVRFGWSWIGQTSYNISNNSPDFYLNIHSSVAIYNSAGNSWGSAPAGISIPIFRSN